MENYRNTSLENIVQEIDGVVYTEEWKHLNVGGVNYLISSFGRVKKTSRFTNNPQRPYTKEKILIGRLNKKGYVRIIFMVNGKLSFFFLHRLVATHFLPNPENKPCVNHKKGIKTHNHYSQIEWCTIAENNRHAYKAGLIRVGKGVRGGTSHIYIKKEYTRCKMVVDTETGQIYTSEKVAQMLGIRRKYVCRILSEERKPNTTKYKYA